MGANYADIEPRLCQLRSKGEGETLRRGDGNRKRDDVCGAGGIGKITWAEGRFRVLSDFGSKGAKIGGEMNHVWEPSVGAGRLF